MRISVVIPAYNAAAFIAATIASARAQTLAPLEIIVVDDGSKDDTALVAAQCGATVLRQANAGVCAARNAGMLAARGEWIALLDHDDTWLPTKLERQAAAVALQPDVACVTTDFFREFDSVRRAVSCFATEGYSLDGFTAVEVAPSVLLLPHAGRELITTGFFMFPSAVLVRRDVMMEAGMFRVELRLCEDVDCFLRVLRHTAMLIVREPLWTWHHHQSNHSNDTTGIAEGWLRLGDFIEHEPDRYPEGIREKIQPVLRERRRDLMHTYTAAGDFESARRVARSAPVIALRPFDAVLAAIVALPPPVWYTLRKARRMARTLFGDGR